MRPPLISTDISLEFILAPMPLSPNRTVAELKELRELTGDENGAQRVAWTDTWEQARAWLRDKVAETGATEEIDEAGNQWFTLRGASERALLIGGHIDSVPNGGWLDGCLDVLAGGGRRRGLDARPGRSAAAEGRGRRAAAGGAGGVRRRPRPRHRGAATARERRRL